MHFSFHCTEFGHIPLFGIYLCVCVLYRWFQREFGLPPRLQKPQISKKKKNRFTVHGDVQVDNGCVFIVYCVIRFKRS